jgi:hypothetical protein
MYVIMLLYKIVTTYGPVQKDSYLAKKGQDLHQ